MALVVGCRGPAAVSSNDAIDAPAPRVIVLGVAQDAGVPQPGCHEDRCEAAASDPERARYVASIAIEDVEGHVYLVDATPDLNRQLRWLTSAGVTSPKRGTRTRTPVDGVFLTHAHMGHYLGLAYFGFEAAHTDAIPVWATPRMVAFLRGNAPWDQLVKLGELELTPLEPGGTVALGELRVTAVPVPHRGEYTDTVAYRVEGPNRTLLYVPDVDPWHRHADGAALELFDGVDVALVDGTFFSGDELPGRDLGAIGHPLMRDTVELLAPLGAAGPELVFIHLNHTNPALDEGAARQELEAAGARVAKRGDAFAL